jgi:hypothetical protein
MGIRRGDVAVGRAREREASFFVEASFFEALLFPVLWFIGSRLRTWSPRGRPTA